MDPFSLTVGSAALVKICFQAIQLIKNTIENVKGAKKLLVKLLNQTERMRLLLEQLRGLTHQLQGRDNLLLTFNDSACKETVNDLKALVHQIVGTTNFLSLQVLLNKGKADDLLKRLHRHEEEIVIVLMSIVAQTTLRTEAEVSLMTNKTASQAEVISMWDAFKISETPEADGISSEFQRYLIWPGYTNRSQFDKNYLDLRDKLSDAAYLGKWNTVLGLLNTAKGAYHQTWVNHPRLSTDPTKTSGWTPLHQAVYMSASEEEVRKLLELGALRTIRTLWAPEFAQHDLTPVELARALGFAHLYEILSPVIRHNITYKTLDVLQERFHTIIRNDLVDGKFLRFPDLVVLTELEEPVMWFPLTAPGATDVKGYLYRLDGRELIVISYGLDAGHESKGYRISVDKTIEIADPILLNT